MEFTKQIRSGIGMGPAFLRCAAAVLCLVNTMAGLSASQTPMAELGW